MSKLTLKQIISQHINPGLGLLPPEMSRDLKAVTVLLLAAHLQESPGQDQCQLPAKAGGVCGPARGIFQMEKGGGVAGVMTHPSSLKAAREVCAKLGISPTIDSVYDALRTTDDRLDVAFARLLYWTDRNALPKYGDVSGAWDYYLRNWRPGAYTRGTDKARADLRSKWSVNYAKAMEALS